MRVTVEDGVYNLLEVKIESMFDNGKGRMIRTDIFLVRVGMRGNLVGLGRRASKSGSREGGSRQWREEIDLNHHHHHHHFRLFFKLTYAT